MKAIVAGQSVVSLRNNKKRGFTLTEIAIVLGIIGLILGAIWVAAGAVYQNLRVSKAQTELLQIAQGVRSLYASQSTVDSAAGTAETSALIAAKVFPSDSIASTTSVDAPWVNSHIFVYSETQPNGVTGDSFQIQFVGIPQSACVSLATNSTGTGRDSALVTVDISATAATAAVTPTYNTFPITAPVAVGKCTSTTSTNTIAFTFALRG